jgi:hypothetical protein
MEEMEDVPSGESILDSEGCLPPYKVQNARSHLDLDVYLREDRV